MQTKYRKWAFFGAALLSLASPMASAGPKKVAKPKVAEPQQAIDPQQAASLLQDTEAAEKAYLKGDVVSAIILWENAAKQGYAPAQARLGDMMDAAEEDKEAVKWYQKAAKAGNAAGEYGLGVMYLKGEGVEKDAEKGRPLIQQAANKNYVPAMKLMMGFYRSGDAGHPVDLEQAGIWQNRIDAVVAQSNPVSAPLPVSAPAAAPANVEKKK